MREIKTTIEISTPITDVWKLLTDINQWSDWSPIIVAASGMAELGNTLNITMIGENGKDGPNYKPIVIINDAPHYFRWSTKMMGGIMFKNDKIFELEATETGTKLTHTEAFGGLMVHMFWGKLQSEVPNMLNAMNDALKRKLETS